MAVIRRNRTNLSLARMTYRFVFGWNSVGTIWNIIVFLKIWLCRTCYKLNLIEWLVVLVLVESLVTARVGGMWVGSVLGSGACSWLPIWIVNTEWLVYIFLLFTCTILDTQVNYSQILRMNRFFRGGLLLMHSCKLVDNAENINHFKEAMASRNRARSMFFIVCSTSEKQCSCYFHRKYFPRSYHQLIFAEQLSQHLYAFLFFLFNIYDICPK